MKLKVLAAAGIVVAIVCGWWLLGRSRHSEVSAPERAAAGSAVRPATRNAPQATTQLVVTVSDTGGPIAGAAIRLEPETGEVVVARTRPDGSVGVEIAPGEWSISASADGHEPAAAARKLEPGETARVALVLAPGGQPVTGTITDATGGPIVGARIDAARLAGGTTPGRAVAIAFSDAAGHYKLSIGAGQVLIAAGHAEYAPQSRYLDVGTSGATANFALVPGGVIEGAVLDEKSRQPVAGAVVRASRDTGAVELAESGTHTAKSGADGKFRLTGLRPGVYELAARESNRTSRTTPHVGLGVAEQQTNVVILVGSGPAIRGRVVDEKGAGAAGVTVRAVGGEGEDGEATADRDGRFAIEGLLPSRWTLLASSDTYLSEDRTGVDLKTRDVDGVVVHVRRGLTVHGHVDPRKSCDVSVASEAEEHTRFEKHSTTTGSDGEFQLAPLPPGKAAIEAHCTDGDEGTLDIEVTPSDGDRLVHVTPGGTIAGRLLDTAGKPIAGVMVSAEHSGEHQTTTIDNGVVTSGFKAVSAITGAFEIRGLSPGTYRLGALDRGRPMKAKKHNKVELAAGQHATGVDVVVERPAGVIQGTITGSDGAPVADAWVSLHQNINDMLTGAMDMLDMSDDSEHGFRNVEVRAGGSGGDQLPPALTDAHGHFELTGVPHGKYQVLAEAQAGKLRGHAADVVPDATIAITLSEVASLRGTVRGANGPADLFEVKLVGPTADSRSFTGGAFEFARVDPGDYTIEVTSSDGTGAAAAKVLVGQPASVDIALVANAVVTGRLVDGTGKPLPGLEVVLTEPQPPGEMSIRINKEPATSGPDGRFEVEGAANHTTLIILGPKPTAKPGLALVAGKTIDIGDVKVDAKP
jgi:protocatechuate 3,4-dioxygenase beta subunit